MLSVLDKRPFPFPPDGDLQMLKSMYALVTAFAVLAFASATYANCGNCGPKKATAEKKCCGKCDGAKVADAGTCSAATCSSATCSASGCDASKGCPIAAAMSKLPKISYAVGEKKTGCPDAAAKMVKESGGHIHFCVGDTEFDSKSEAQEALLVATEKFVADFAKPHYVS